MKRLKPSGPRGGAMLFLAFIAFSRFWVYVQPTNPEFTPSILIEWPVPVWVWGLLWLGVGLYVMVAAFRKRQALALALFEMMLILWAVVYVISAWNRVAVAGWDAAQGSIITAVIYVAVAGVTYFLSQMLNVRVDKAGKVEADG